jgi:pyruvate/2-oxoglutarate dehydrogenase complex dihydrolipoamide dehydrogenase (E3) component
MGVEFLSQRCRLFREIHTEEAMAQAEQFEILVLGSGTGGKLIAWHMAGAGQRTAVVERKWVGGSCPNIACMPSKNEIWSAKAAYFMHHAAEYGMTTGQVAIAASASARWSRPRSPRICATTKRPAPS